MNIHLLIILDKFDQFWAVNRRLMEVPVTSSSNADGGNNLEFSQVSSCFKHIPIRLYEGDKSMIQKLIKPTVNATNSKSSQKEVMINMQDNTYLGSKVGLYTSIYGKQAPPLHSCDYSKF